MTLEEQKEQLKKELKDAGIDLFDKIVPIMEISDNKVLSDRFSTGFKVFDEAMDNGFKVGDLAIISGQPGVGKTTFAQTLTYNLCKNEVPCLWFSFEVVVSELKKKFMKMGIDQEFMTYVPRKNISSNVEWIKERIERGLKDFMTKVIFIDMIDNVTPKENKPGDLREQTLKNITKELKDIAIEQEITIVLMVHLKKTDLYKEPDMSDIGYSGGIAQLADYVFMLYKEPTKASKLKKEDISGIFEETPLIVKIEKNRETGKKAYVKTTFNNGKLIQLEENLEETLNKQNYEY